MNRVRIIATKVADSALRPGDLFSEKGPEYWSNAMNKGMICDCSIVPNGAEFDSNDTFVYRLTIVQEGDTTTRDAHKMREGFDPHSPPGESGW